MAIQILFNLIIAVLWMLLHNAWDSLTFMMGYALGIFLIFILRNFFPSPFYGKRVVAIIKLILIFIREIIKSSFVVIGQVISPRIKIQPGVIRFETTLKGDWELTTLCNLITLTPGSVVIEVAPEEGILYIHVMELADFDGFIAQTRGFEKAILEVMN